MKQLKGTQIKNLITKFFYKDNQLCFQILIHCETDQTISYREFSDYSAYKEIYDKLLKAKAENALISIAESQVKSTHMEFA